MKGIGDFELKQINMIFPDVSFKEIPNLFFHIFIFVHFLGIICPLVTVAWLREDKEALISISISG